MEPMMNQKEPNPNRGTEHAMQPMIESKIDPVIEPVMEPMIESSLRSERSSPFASRNRKTDLVQGKASDQKCCTWRWSYTYCECDNVHEYPPSDVEICSGRNAADSEEDEQEMDMNILPEPYVEPHIEPEIEAEIELEPEMEMDPELGGGQWRRVYDSFFQQKINRDVMKESTESESFDESINDFWRTLLQHYDELLDEGLLQTCRNINSDMNREDSFWRSNSFRFEEEPHLFRGGSEFAELEIDPDGPLHHRCHHGRSFQVSPHPASPLDASSSSRTPLQSLAEDLSLVALHLSSLRRKLRPIRVTETVAAPWKSTDLCTEIAAQESLQTQIRAQEANLKRIEEALEDLMEDEEEDREGVEEESEDIENLKWNEEAIEEKNGGSKTDLRKSFKLPKDSGNVQKLSKDDNGHQSIDSNVGMDRPHALRFFDFGPSPEDLLSTMRVLLKKCHEMRLLSMEWVVLLEDLGRRCVDQVELDVGAFASGLKGLEVDRMFKGGGRGFDEGGDSTGEREATDKEIFTEANRHSPTHVQEPPPTLPSLATSSSEGEFESSDTGFGSEGRKGSLASPLSPTEILDEPFDATLRSPKEVERIRSVEPIEMWTPTRRSFLDHPFQLKEPELPQPVAEKSGTFFPSVSPSPVHQEAFVSFLKEGAAMHSTPNKFLESEFDKTLEFHRDCMEDLESDWERPPSTEALRATKTPPQKRRTLRTRRAAALDTDSDVEDVHHVIRESRGQLQLTKAALVHFKTAFSGEGSVQRPSKYNDLLATCSTNAACLVAVAKGLRRRLASSDEMREELEAMERLVDSWEDVMAVAAFQRDQAAKIRDLRLALQSLENSCDDLRRGLSELNPLEYRPTAFARVSRALIGRRDDVVDRIRRIGNIEAELKTFGEENPRFDICRLRRRASRLIDGMSNLESSLDERIEKVSRLLEKRGEILGVEKDALLLKKRIESFANCADLSWDDREMLAEDATMMKQKIQKLLQHLTIENKDEIFPDHLRVNLEQAEEEMDQLKRIVLKDITMEEEKESQRSNRIQNDIEDNHGADDDDDENNNQVASMRLLLHHDLCPCRNHCSNLTQSSRFSRTSSDLPSTRRNFLSLPFSSFIPSISNFLPFAFRLPPFSLLFVCCSLAFLLLSCGLLLRPDCCSRQNRFRWSLLPQLRYPDGQPPI